ncbi:MAG: hypothetical protein LBR80_10750 [Deltaproteobacteria bacterium]|nr:hypothetical protein [Deltaproteobacteria bacterium]
MTPQDIKDKCPHCPGGILLEWKENGQMRRLLLECFETERGRELQICWLDKGVNGLDAPAIHMGKPSEPFGAPTGCRAAVAETSRREQDSKH